MKITELEHIYLSIYLNENQKSFLGDLIKKYNLKIRISRSAINLNRFNRIYNNLAYCDKCMLEKIFSKVTLRSGASKIVSVPFDIKINEDMCELYGFLTGDGNMLRVCRFYNTDKFLVDRLDRIIYNNFKVKSRDERSKGSYYIPKVVQVILENLFCKKGYSRTAKVPSNMFKLNKNLVGLYIRALFDTDGCVINDPPKLASKSLILAMGIKRLLYNKFSIESRIRGNGKDGYELVIGNGDKYNVYFNTLKFYENISFYKPDKRKELERKVKERTLYKTLQLVNNGYNTSNLVSNKLGIDLSTTITHLNTLEQFNYINKSRNSKKYIWAINNPVGGKV